MKQIIWGGIAIINDQFLTHWGVYIEGKLIIDVDTFENLKKRYPKTEIIGGENLLLIPGLVNSHDHGRVISPVGFNIDDTWLELWLLQLEKLPNIDPDLAASIEGITLLKSGVTTVSHSHNPRNWDNLYQEASDTIKGYQNAGIRVAFHPPIVDQNLLDYTNKDQVLSSLSPSLLQQFKKYQNTPSISNQDYFAICSQLFNHLADIIMSID
ncbi:putative amidohydrolase [Crocosphaera subtropica ATCC 51142]|uniref:Amidohydrolase n=1 Tax=Crocosphaera subtropica (strain ATCC 51142 / BH68) TaxID=43989 RepID=B1WYQ1_CROS5|nr:amidohydrolase [Crocosphaera subtropica]ACB51068.1 putative amidohydrolase [Crocosphaera subtropica ATCC 51142]